MLGASALVSLQSVKRVEFLKNHNIFDFCLEAFCIIHFLIRKVIELVVLILERKKLCEQQ